VAEPLLEAGIHVLAEKPLAATSEDCRALIEAARRGGALLGVNQNLLFNPAYLVTRMNEVPVARLGTPMTPNSTSSRPGWTMSTM